MVSNDLFTDQRVHKVCSYLHNRGYKVRLYGRKLPDSISLKGRPYKTRRYKMLFNQGPLFYACLNLRFFFTLLFTKTDFILCNDLDTLLAGKLAHSLKRNCTLVYDSHEFYTGVPELVNRPKVQAVWVKIEKWIFPKLDKIYTVNESIAKLYKELYQKELVVLRNISPKRLVTCVIKKAEIDIPEDKKIIVFQGAGINVDRGAEEAVEAMKTVDNAVLLFVGDGDVIPFLKEKVEKEKLHDRIRFFGKQSYEEMMKYTTLADIGLSLDKGNNVNYVNSLPNKIFDYIQAGTPVLASNIKEVSAVVLKYQVGEILDTVDAKSLSEKLNSMLSDTEKQQFYRINCLKTAEKLCWEEEVRVLDNIYPL
ncbi:MAG: glycosyltransferase involved in cell wall biosynthesis [Psychromonas sp.]|jgi:glycosyltransferase involved in cell wall biosynthesis